MSIMHSCDDLKDILDFFRGQGLYLKPISRLNISVQLPALKKSGSKIANWEVMEKVKEMGKPFHFSVFKVAKSSLEFIRFEAELENYGSLEQCLAKLDMKTIKLSGFTDVLKVRAAESKIPFPSRNEWDSFFANNKNMNEMKPGERPDTIYVSNLPCKWFLKSNDRSGISRDKPSESVLKRVFEAFGDIRAVDIPCLDPYREKMKKSIAGSISTFSFGQDLVFDAYIQYKEYIGFVKAMNSLKGMKLLYKDRYEERSWVSNIKVDFDRTKHLSESMIKRRAAERDKLIEKEREREDADRRKRELEELKKADELRRMTQEERERERKKKMNLKIKETRRMEREERRRKLKLGKKYKNEDEKIAEEEKKLIIAQRKLESIRLLDELLERVKTVKSRSDNVKNLEADLLQTARKAKEKAAESHQKAEHISLDKKKLITYKDQDEKLLRDKLVSKLKQKEVDKVEHQKRRIQKIADHSDLEDLTETEEDEEIKSNGGVEDISEDELENISDVDDSVEDNSDEELRLTSSSDEESKTKKKRKKDKKKKKKKEKKKSKSRRELDSHISLAQRIANREKRSRSRSRERKRRREREGERRRNDDSFSSKRRRHDNHREEGYPDYRAIQVMRERDQRRLAKRFQSRFEEKQKEELYDKMMNPHLYGESFGGGYRRLKKGEHYEDVQKEYLNNEIRIRERREAMKRKRVDVDFYPRNNRQRDNYYSSRTSRRY